MVRLSLLGAAAALLATSASTFGLSTARSFEEGDQLTHLFDRNVEKTPQGFQVRKRQSSDISSANAYTSRGLGVSYPDPGDKSPPRSSLPQIWIDRYNDKKAAGLIPDFPPSVTLPSGYTKYPDGTNLDAVCSWTLSKCNKGNIWTAPPGKVGITFDDGPTPASVQLSEYLSEQNISATHFLIGSAIIYNADTMKQLARAEPPMHFGSHTFSHTLMTSRTDMELLGEFGWSSQLIFDFTGKVINTWRPAQGDTDARVSAIAREVFGLQTVMWDNDADDWCLRNGRGTAQLDTCLQGVGKSYNSVRDEMVSWTKADKSKVGFISLEHETTDQAVNVFKEYYTALKSEGWTVSTVADLQDLPWYSNQYDPDTRTRKVDSILPTRDPIQINDPAAQPGSASAPDTSAWQSLKSSSKQSSNSDTSSSTGSSASAGTGTSGASASRSATSSSASSTTSAQGQRSGADAQFKSSVIVFSAGVAIAAASVLF